MRNGFGYLGRFRDDIWNRVFAPEGEVLFFACPRQLLHALLYLLHPFSRKKNDQKKRYPLPRLSCVPQFCWGFAKGEMFCFLAAFAR
jgi:hypothetical protein